MPRQGHGLWSEAARSLCSAENEKPEQDKNNHDYDCVRVLPSRTVSRCPVVLSNRRRYASSLYHIQRLACLFAFLDELFQVFGARLGNRLLPTRTECSQK